MVRTRVDKIVDQAPEPAQLLFADLALVLVLARVLGAAARRLRQPPVVGELWTLM